jgi:DNA (cytosine-5)-methyltransferase 1
MKIGSLFSGAGMLDKAVEHVFGGEVVWHCEQDKAASKVLAHHWPSVPNLGDITAVDWTAVEPVDVLCGGFPCQDVSAAGKRAGIKDGTRSGLWAVFADAIDTLRPSIVIIENVRGLLSARAHRNLEPADTTLGNESERLILRAAGAVLGDLADLGYDAQWATIAAGDVGAPHRRERVFIVAYAERGGAARVAVAGGNCEADSQGRQAVLAGGLGDQHVSGAGHVELLPTPQAHDSQGPKTPEQIATMRAKGAGVRNLNETAVYELLRTPQANITEAKPGIKLQGRTPADPQVGLADQIMSLLPTPNASDASGGGAHPDKREGHSRQLIDYALLDNTTAWGKYAPAIRRWESLTRPAPAPTEPNKNGNPRLSAAFSQWLMGWPDGWVTDPSIGISRNDQLRIVGNGVCPQQAVAALEYLLNVCEVVA